MGASTSGAYLQGRAAAGSQQEQEQSILIVGNSKAHQHMANSTATHPDAALAAANEAAAATDLPAS